MVGKQANLQRIIHKTGMKRIFYRNKRDALLHSFEYVCYAFMLRLVGSQYIYGVMLRLIFLQTLRHQFYVFMKLGLQFCLEQELYTICHIFLTGEVHFTETADMVFPVSSVVQQMLFFQRRALRKVICRHRLALYLGLLHKTRVISLADDILHILRITHDDNGTFRQQRPKRLQLACTALHLRCYGHTVTFLL